jgi:hypothetical protein
VTDSDFLGAIVGELGCAGKPVSSGIQQRDEQSWLVQGGLPVEDLQDVLELESLPGQEDHQYTTIAGFVLHQFGRIPQEADHFTWNGLRFEVVSMDGRRVDKVLVSRVTPIQPAACRWISVGIIDISAGDAPVVLWKALETARVSASGMGLAYLIPEHKWRGRAEESGAPQEAGEAGSVAGCMRVPPFLQRCSGSVDPDPCVSVVI